MKFFGLQSGVTNFKITMIRLKPLCEGLITVVGRGNDRRDGYGRGRCGLKVCDNGV